MVKKYFIIFCLILFIISLTAVSATSIVQTDFNSDIIALSDDDSIEISADSGTFAELQDKINNAGEGSTVELFNNYTYDDTFPAMGIIINKSLTIEGNGFTIDGANHARIFFINNTNDIVLNNIIFTNATFSSGGAISVEGNADFITFTNCEFINNTATTHGGSIQFSGYTKNLFINNTIFDRNYAPYGGALFLKAADELLINNSEFSNNNGRDNYTIYGGSIYVMDNLTNASILCSLFENNGAYSGGAIFVEGIMNHNTIYNTNFTNNTAFTTNIKYGGGSIAVNGNATNNIINQSRFYLNCDQTHGGNINFLANASNNIITESEFIDNNGRYGCALAVNKNNENMEISKCIFATYNKGKQEVIGGGALYFINGGYNINITDCIFKCNVARAGGSIYFEKKAEKSRIENCTFENNKVTTANKEFGGGAISIDDAVELIIVNCKFINSTASTRGGAIFIKNPNNVLIDNNIFVNNSATLGKAIYLKTGDAIIQDSQFINNTGGKGDIYYLGHIDSSIINSTFEGENHIFVGLDASVILFNNKELDSYKIGDYFVYSDGVLSLENNTLTNVIYNNGKITSPTTMICLNNETVNTTDEVVSLTAKCVDDNDNYIVSDYGFFYMNESDIKAFYGDDVVLYLNVYTNYDCFIVNATTSGLLSNCTYKIGKVNIVPKKAVFINASDILLDIGQYGEIEVELSEDAIGTVSANIGDEKYLAVIKNGKATIIIPPFEPGEYEAVIHFPGDINYGENYTRILITVLDKISVNAPDVTKYYGGSERFVVNVTKSDKPVDNATVIIEINGVSYTKQTDETGTVSIALGLPRGVYTANVKVDDISVNSSVTILPTVNGTDIIKVYKNETQYYATFVDSNGNYLASGTNVTFNIHGIFYNRTISGDKGLAKLNINLAQGEYIITAINPNTTEKSSNIITVISRIINNSNITKFYRNETQYTAIILGDDGKPVGQGEIVKFNINGVMYEKQTNESGQVKLNINLLPGDYIITAEYKGCMVSNNIKVLPVIIAQDLTKQYGTDTPFEAKLVDGQGNAYANQKIEFNINGVFYYKSTDGDGIAKLNINLQPGDYIITSSYNGCYVANSIKVLSRLTADDLVKTYGSDDQFYAKLVDGQGNPVSNVNIQFNINGVLYLRPTDSNGIAKLNINLQAGEYIITSSYEKFACSNTIKVVL